MGLQGEEPIIPCHLQREWEEMSPAHMMMIQCYSPLMMYISTRINRNTLNTVYTLWNIGGYFILAILVSNCLNNPNMSGFIIRERRYM